MNDAEFLHLLSDTKVINSEDIRVQRWRQSIERIMAAYPCDREKATTLIMKRIEKDRKKRIPPDKSLAQFVVDVESSPIWESSQVLRTTNAPINIGGSPEPPLRSFMRKYAYVRGFNNFTLVASAGTPESKYARAYREVQFIVDLSFCLYPLPSANRITPLPGA